jgi:SAM-dependent methyltransferase
MRRDDELGASTMRTVVDRLVEPLREGAVVADIGPGAGGMSAAFALALAERAGGTVVVVDAVPELLAAAEEKVRQTVPSGRVEVTAVQVDAASDDLPELLPKVDLVWASRVVHHLPDQLKGIVGLSQVLADGGWLALSEGGLPTRCLPWDLGVGEPGLGDRLAAEHAAWFADMRASMPGATRMPMGWAKALSSAGLDEVSSFSYLVDRPAPASAHVRQSVVDWLSWCAGVAAERLDDSDQVALTRLLDPVDPAYVGSRDDVFVLSAATIHVGRKVSSPNE